ncbi:sphingosine-1-phosphate transporter SPNS2 isoform X4 [Acinonyx jubatus]|uniref:Sphingosine-1-phosphate transporter SPNS2 isoform X4 n=1 Tax=Acinonyx jubatus TaxID=32536 RepID=A0ABM3PAK7_ACIJB|nr:sphingosine-1-phosphate transporter SPNS2 isoform X4 [Acinonyx jubatus]
MMCLECASAAAGGAEEEEADAERRRRRRGAQRGAGGGGCCGARGVGAAGAAAADDEVQTLSGSVRRAPSGPPGTPGTPGCAAAAKGPGAQQPKPASLGRGRGAAAAILSLGNVLNYLDRYTVAGGCADLGHGGLWCQKKSGLHLAGSGDPQSTTAALLGELIQVAPCEPCRASGVLLDIQQQFGVKDRGAGLLQSALLAAGPVTGAGGHRRGQLLHHRAHHHRRPLHQEHAHAHAVRLLLCHPAGQVSPIVGMITGTLILILVPATKRGHADQLGGQLKVRTSWLRDMKALIRNRSYVFSSLATSAVSFATGALGMWIPLYLHRAQVVQKTADTCSSPPCGAKDSLIFGAITCFTGFLGVVTGAGATRWCRLRTQRADPLVCAVGMLGSAIFVCLIFVAAKSSIVGAYVCIFVGETLLFSNWAITADILMYVVIPTRRATAVALQSFTSHLLGDAGSPYLIGFISDLIRQSTKDSPLWEFLSLGYALMLCPFVVVLGGMFFLATALFFLGDRAKAEQQALPPSPGADEVPARHVRPAGPRDAMRQSSARARPQLIRHLDPRPSLPQGEPAGDATRTRQSLRPCPQDGEETVPSPYLGGVPGHPGPAGLTRSFLCDPRLGTHPLWCGPAEWPWHQEAASSTDVEGCVWGSRTDGQTPSRWGPGRTQPPARVWGEPGASPPYMVLGGWTFPRDSFGDPGLHREGAAQASGRSFRL